MAYTRLVAGDIAWEDQKRIVKTGGPVSDARRGVANRWYTGLDRLLAERHEQTFDCPESGLNPYTGMPSTIDPGLGWTVSKQTIAEAVGAGGVAAPSGAAAASDADITSTAGTEAVVLDKAVMANPFVVVKQYEYVEA